MAKDTSPEERLLNLIKSKNKKAAGAPVHVTASAPAAAPKAPERMPAEIVVSKAGARISGMLKSEFFKNKFFEPVMLKAVNKYLIIILGVLLLYFLIDLIVVRPSKNVQLLITKTAAEQSRKALPAGTKNVAAAKDYSSYSNAVPGRTVFGPGGAAAPEDISASGGMTEQIGLVGIIAGDNPQAIIEDKKAQKTYYLNKGQSFNGYVVEDISKDKVMLDYDGKKISLFL